ncbi:MAG: shikimate kinase AroK [Pseudomonadales bacterium]
MSKPNIILIGLMAVGKSTVGRMLANLLDYQFYDADQVIEARAGAPIPWIFDREGEAGFRDREQQVLDDLTRESGIVLATGGGAVLRPANRELLRERGVVVLLESSIDRLVERTRRDTKRPLLRQGDPREVLTRLAKERGPLYAEIAHFRFMTDRRGPKSLARDIVTRLREAGIVASPCPSEPAETDQP